MTVVVLVAFDFGIVRALWDAVGQWAEIAIVTLPMIDVLLLTLPYVLRKSSPTRPFWGGFHVIGWIGVLICSLMVGCFPNTFFWPLTALEWVFASPRSALGTAGIISAAVVMYTTPQLLTALLAGWWSSRYRLVIECRRDGQG